MLHRASLRDVIDYASPLRGDRRALGRDRGAARDRSMRRGSSGGGGAASPWTLEWDSDDAVFSAHALTDHPPRVGTATITVDGTEVPTDLGYVANGHTPVTFGPTASSEGGRYATSSADGMGSSTAYTFEVVSRPANVTGVANQAGGGDREYHCYFKNSSVTAGDHHVIAHIANDAALGGTVYDQLGTYTAGNWSYIAAATVPVDNRLHVETWVVAASGVIKYFRNGVLVDDSSMTWTPATIALNELVFGMSYAPGDTAPFRGAVYSYRMCPSELADAVVIAQQEERVARYGIPTSTWRPTDVASCKGWFTEHGLVVVAGAVTISQWVNHTTANNPTQGTAGSRPTLGRISGLLAPDLDGSDDRLTGSAASNYLSTTAYEYVIAFEPDAVSQTTAVGYNGAALIDSGGFFWCALRNNAGSYEVRAGHWDGAEKSLTITGVTLGAVNVVHVWYDGTNLHGRLGSASEVTTVAAGACTNLTNQLHFGGRTATQAFNGRIAHAMIFNAALSSGDRTLARARMAEDMGVTL